MHRTLTRSTSTLITSSCGTRPQQPAASQARERTDRDGAYLYCKTHPASRGVSSPFMKKAIQHLKNCRPRSGNHHRARRPLQDAIPRAELSDAGAVHRLPAVERQGRADHLQSPDRGRQGGSADAGIDPEIAARPDADAGAVEAEAHLYPRAGPHDARRAVRFDHFRALEDAAIIEHFTRSRASASGPRRCS